MEILSIFQYKKLFLPNIKEKILANNAAIQLYRLEDYIKDIVIPVVPYRTTFNFLIFVTKGWIKQLLDGEEYVTETAGVILIKQGAVTATLELSDDLEGFYMTYEDIVLSEREYSLDKANIFFMTPCQKLDNLTFTTLASLFVLLEQELLLANLDPNELIVTMLHLILLKLLNVDHKNQHLWSSRPMEVSLLFRDLLFKYHIHEKKVSFYAEKLSVTNNYLTKCIKSVTQKSPKQWINEVDINHGKALLHSSKGVAEIAYELNFQTSSHFTQLFKKITGLTPKAYRQQLEKNNLKQ